MSMLYLLLNLALVLVLVALVYMQQEHQWITRCSLRREFLMLEGIHEVSKGVSSGDQEAAVGALMEHFQRMSTELEWQNTHSYSLKHPLTMPDLPDYEALLTRDPVA